MIYHDKRADALLFDLQLSQFSCSSDRRLFMQRLL
jgi:hypothetical protein